MLLNRKGFTIIYEDVNEFERFCYKKKASLAGSFFFKESRRPRNGLMEAYKS